MDLTPEFYRVSYHAVIRFVERILLVTPAGDDPALQPEARAQLYCDAAGTTIDKVRGTILTPAVLMACRMGVPSIGNRLFQAKIRPAKGIVATIYEARERKHPKLRGIQTRHDIAHNGRRQQALRPSIYTCQDDGDIA